MALISLQCLETDVITVDSLELAKTVPNPFAFETGINLNVHHAEAELVNLSMARNCLSAVTGKHWLSSLAQ